MSFKIHDRVLFRDSKDLTRRIIGVIDEASLAGVPKYGVKFLNHPYKGQRVAQCSEADLSKTDKQFAKVLIVGGGTGYFNLMKEVADSVIENTGNVVYRHADLVLFTGGEDVSPFMYGEQPHEKTFFNPKRDSQEAMIYREAKRLGIPCAGICRGSQFLNVMNKGRLVQHVTNHTSPHKIKTSCGHEFKVSSTHHQMMDPGESAEILGWADQLSDQYSGLKEFVPCTHENKVIEPEIVLYRKSKDLCVQYHPEMMGQDTTGRKFFTEILKELHQ